MPSEPVNLDRVLENAHVSLTKIVGCVTVDPTSQPAHFFALCHAKRLHSLAVELDRTVASGGVHSPPIVARAMLESLFKLGIVAGTEANRFTLALEKAVQELEWEMIQDLFPSPDTKELSKIRQSSEYKKDIEPTVKNLRTRWNLPDAITPGCERYLSTWWCAKNAGLEKYFKGDYRILSKVTHALASDFVSTSVTYSRGASARIMLETSRCLMVMFPNQVPAAIARNVNDCWQTIHSKQWVGQFMASVTLETLVGIRPVTGGSVGGAALN